MSKERIKTLLLTVLVLSSIVFSGQIWFDKKLWPDGYDFFSVYEGTFIEKIGRLFYKEPAPLTINETGALDSVFSPKTIYLTYADGRLSFNTTQEEGKEITSVFNNIIKTALSSNTYIEITESEWQSQLSARSIYADYSVPISFRAFGQFLDLSNVSITGMTSFDQVVIVPDEFSVNTVPVLFRDRESKKQIKILTTMDKSMVSEILSNHEMDVKLNLSYAFDMNLDTRIEGEGMEHQKVIFDSYILLPLDPIRMNVIENKPVDLQNNETLDNVLKVFEYNPHTVKRFTETNDSILFVDTDSTLRIRKDGYLEYKASDSSKGLKIGNDRELTTAVVGSAQLIDNLLGCFPMNESTKLFINSPLNDDNEQSTYTFHFDYLFNGTPIVSDGHAATVEVSGGNIISLKVYIKNYEEIEEGSFSNAQDAIDRLYLQYASEYSEVYIQEFYPGYRDNGGAIELSWQAVIADKDELISIQA